MLKTGRETMWLQLLSMAHTEDLRVLDVGGREGTLRVPRGQPKGRAPHALQLFSTLPPSFLLGGWGWGLAVKGQEKWEDEEESSILPLNNKTNEREQRVIFAPQKMEIQGRLGVQWMETSKLLRRRQPTVIGSLRPPIGWEKKVPPPPPQPGAVSLSTPVAQLGLGESAPRSAKPRPGAAFARRVRPSRGPAPPRTEALGSASAGCGLSPWVPNIPRRHVAPRTVEIGLKCGRVAKHTLPGPSPSTAGGSALEENLRWCRAARGTVEVLPIPTSNSSTAPRGGPEPAAEPESACPAAGPGLSGGQKPPRRAGEERRIFPSGSCKNPALFFPGRARGKKETIPSSHLLGHYFWF